jgi:hypothetical protein
MGCLTIDSGLDVWPEFLAITIIELKIIQRAVLRDTKADTELSTLDKILYRCCIYSHRVNPKAESGYIMAPIKIPLKMLVAPHCSCSHPVLFKKGKSADFVVSHVVQTEIIYTISNSTKTMTLEQNIEFPLIAMTNRSSISSNSLSELTPVSLDDGLPSYSDSVY